MSNDTKIKLVECERCGKEFDWNDSHSCCYCGIEICQECLANMACIECEEANS